MTRVARAWWLRGLVVHAVVLFGLAALPAVAIEKVGELELANLRTLAPYAAGIEEWVVHYPGATYIRVHFSRFDLAPGDRVVVSSPDGAVAHVYEDRGPFGTGEFWAFAVDGDTAIVRLEAASGGGGGVEIDSYGRGIVPILPSPGEPESVCGTQDWRDVECYRDTFPTEYDRARGAVLALIGCCSSCTAFKASDSGQFMTNNHCTASQTGVQSTELRMEYKLSGCGSGTSGYSGSVFGSTLQKTDALLDYTLFTTTGDSSSIPCLPLDNRLPPAGERIYIAGHPAGGVKKLSLESTHSSNPTGFCEVDASPYPGNDSTSDIGYYCDTTNGSSGSPVLSGDTHKVVALHHFGGCLNSGARMDRIYPQIAGLLTGCSAAPSTCGNGTIDPGEDCDGEDLGGATCQDLGFDGGQLACSPNTCTYDTSGCTSACVPVSKGRCNCDGKCSRKESSYVSSGGVCADCP